ncbi:T9SS type A sorting domain-containing protein [uncultured Nonlabens sp.]|uniref:T9SS type A sorting domain-containing protein n=1 Tax=uncultured Nonlabens sp. TaxID=859306 RepID=UPI002627CB94|nr:T9SS type A sorting domain-containing protein [uncultured Nonlabens sp.]
MNRILLFILLSVFTFSQSTATLQKDSNDSTITVKTDKEKEKLTIITNPVNDGYLKITFLSNQSKDITVTIINSLGKQVYNAKRGVNRDVQTFDISKLTAGIYFLRVNTSSSNFVKKLIVR